MRFCMRGVVWRRKSLGDWGIDEVWVCNEGGERERVVGFVVELLGYSKLVYIKLQKHDSYLSTYNLSWYTKTKASKE